MVSIKSVLKANHASGRLYFGLLHKEPGKLNITDAIPAKL